MFKICRQRIFLQFFRTNYHGGSLIALLQLRPDFAFYFSHHLRIIEQEGFTLSRPCPILLSL